MDQMSARQLALSYTGMFLGAGFVSGQELWQFFACFGPIGLLGFVGTAAIFFYLCYAALSLAHATGQTDMTRMLTWGDRPRLRAVVRAMQCLFLFGISVIMIAGASVLLHQLTGVPSPLCGALFTLAVALTAMLGLQGLVAAFSVLVPATTVCAVGLAAAVLIRSGFQFAPAAGSVSVLLPNWVVGFLTYAAYNLFGCISILMPFARLLPDQRTILRGLGSGSVLLLMLAWSMIAAMAVRPSSGASELPMSLLAGELHPALEVVYGLLMGLGMFSAALATMTAALSQLELRWPVLAPRRRLMVAGLYTAAFVLSLLGFGSLVGLVYPLFGYAGIPLLVCLVLNWRKVRTQTRQAPEESSAVR